MKKGMKWFKKKLDDIEVNTTSLQNYDAIWMLNRVHELYDQLDEPEVTLNRAFEKVSEIYPMTKEEVCRHLERVVAHGGKVTYGEPEVLSQNWIDEHAKSVAYDGIPDETEIVYVDELENLLVPKKELPVIPRFVAEWIKEMKQDERSLYSAMSSLMNKTNHTWSVWKSANKNFSEIVAQAWLDGFTVEEEPKYYALIKGHELVKGKGNWVPKYWNLRMATGDMFISNRNTVRDKYVIKMSKSEWGKVGINDSNADFVKVEEMEE